MLTHTGRCHCGSVKFEVEAPEIIEVLKCNCSICSMTSFLHLYIPRSNPDGYSVNVRCLDKSNIKEIKIVQFDGQNWDESAKGIKHLSQ